MKFFKEKFVSLFFCLIIAVGCFTSVYGEAKHILQKKGIIASENKSDTVKIDWESLYPHKNIENKIKSNSSVVEKYKRMVNKSEKYIEDSVNYIFGYQKIMELNGSVNKLVGKKSFSGSNSVIGLKNGYLTSSVSKYSDSDLKTISNSISSLNDFCKQSSIPFTYVQTPDKVCSYDNQLPENSENYVNENIDNVLIDLKQKNIDTFDLRESIKNSKLDYYKMFYVTDHHWTVSTGLWAAGQMGNYLNQKYSLDLKTEFSDKSMYNENRLKNYFLGSLGKKVTLGYTKAEDFSYLVPNFDTSLTVVNKDKNMNKTGSFDDVIYDKKRLLLKDYYNNSNYEAFLFGNRPVTRIINNDNKKGKKILIIKDSFSLVFAPYFSLMAGQIDLIDIRSNQGNFTGSIKTYIEKENPDMVVLMYCPTTTESLE